jgi:hypothetical protein
VSLATPPLFPTFASYATPSSLLSPATRLPLPCCLHHPPAPSCCPLSISVFFIKTSHGTGRFSYPPPPPPPTNQMGEEERLLATSL